MARLCKLLQTAEPQFHHECERHAVSGRMCSHGDPPWQQQIDILIQTPLWGMPGWLLCIHGFAFVFQPSNRSSAPGWSSLEESIPWGTDVNLTGLHQAPALNTVLLECFQDKWQRMTACPLRLCLWTDHMSASLEATFSVKICRRQNVYHIFSLHTESTYKTRKPVSFHKHLPAEPAASRWV